MKKLIPFFFLLVSQYSEAQNWEDLTQYKSFFNQQAKEYQRWLDQTGLGGVLYVKLVDTRTQELPLYLAFRYQNIDSISVAWKSLKSKFEAVWPQTLEAALFYKLTYLMEVPDSLANVQIYNTYDPAKAILFFRGIYHDGKKVKVDSFSTKADASFSIQLRDLRGLSKAGVELQLSRLSKPIVFQKVYEYAKLRYLNKNQKSRMPRIELRDSIETLRFEIKDLDREVLTDEDQPYWCKLIKRIGIADCNWVKREMLAFNIQYFLLPSGGFQLKIIIDGKVGSGYYDKIRDNAYKPMDIDFSLYLERYAEKFRLGLRNYLLNVKP